MKETKAKEVPDGTPCIYMLECGDGSFYTGWTNHLEKRIKSHQTGKGARYTKTHLPVKLIYVETFETKQQAQSREWQIKQMTRKQKEELLKSSYDQ